MKPNEAAARVIGICGGSGSGKSTLCARCAARGAEIIDADRIARSLTAAGFPLLSRIRDTFGDGVIAGDGTLDRRALAAIVFSDPQELARLNAICHPEIVRRIRERLEQSRAETVIIDAAVLHEAGLERLCDKTVFVTAPTPMRIQRIMARDGLTEQQASARIGAQSTEEEYRAKTDQTVVNDGTVPLDELTDLILS